MRKILLVLSLLMTGFLFYSSPASAQTLSPLPKQEFYKAKVLKIVSEGKKEIGGKQNIYQTVQVEVTEGPDKGKTVTIEHGGMFTITSGQKLNTSQTVILRSSVNQAGKTTYYVSDVYRLQYVVGILIVFFLVVVAIARRKGLGAMIGLLFSLAVIMWYIIPQILAGSDPMTIAVFGSIIILGVTMYLAHGFSKQTHIALAATAISICITAILAILFVELTKLSGLGSEDAYSLQQGFSGIINFKGLLLGGIIIGALGVLDDVTTTQAATIHELSEANPKATFESLVKRGMRVGREHIASVVNTLVLAYAGASIGLFIYLHLGIQQNTQPLWVMLNSEVIVEEIVRTLAGSLGLIFAVPITTLLAAFFAKNSIKIT